MEQHPELHMKFGWTSKHIGVFLKCRLLTGYYNTNLRVSMIELDSLYHLIEFTNKLLDNQKVKLQHG